MPGQAERARALLDRYDDSFGGRLMYVHPL